MDRGATSGCVRSRAAIAVRCRSWDHWTRRGMLAMTGSDGNSFSMSRGLTFFELDLLVSVLVVELECAFAAS